MEEINPLLLGRSTAKEHDRLTACLKYFTFFQENGLYFFVYTDEGRTTLKIFFDALARENPRINYDYLFKTLEPNYKIKASHFLRLLYDIT